MQEPAAQSELVENERLHRRAEMEHVIFPASVSDIDVRPMEKCGIRLRPTVSRCVAEKPG
jgi:hypothetical protein